LDHLTKDRFPINATLDHHLFGQSEEETIRLYSILTPEEGADIDEVKEQWFIAFSILLNEANSNTNN